MKRLLAMVKARLLETVRDRSALAWNLIFAPLLVIGMATVFSGHSRAVLSVGVLSAAAPTTVVNPFVGDEAISLRQETSRDDAITAVRRQNLDLLLDLHGTPLRYWMNTDSAKGRLLQSLLLARQPGAQMKAVTGTQSAHSDWLVPGLLGINIMFSSLFAIGHVIVRYRKSGYLKRLNGTPLRAVEFISAQLLACLIIIVVVAVAVFVACKLLLHLHVEGSYLDLLLITTLGSMSMISMSLLVSARVSSEELSGGLLNLLSWPMVILSGAFFPLDGAPRLVRDVADLFPLTQMLDAARAVMLDGAGLVDVERQVLTLSVMTVAFLALGARMFRWTPE